MKSLFALDASGKTIREWCIYEDGDEIVVEYGTYGGEMTEHREVIEENKSGRDLDEQIQLVYESKIAKKRDAGYVDTIEQAKNGRRNGIGFLKPMLAHKFSPKMKIDYSNAYIQRKYDGNRCLITNVSGELLAYTRNGKVVKTIDHILKGIDIPDGMTLDGEIYCHGKSLQTIVSWIKKKQSESELLEYHAYDMISDEAFPVRYEELQHYSLGDSVHVAETEKIGSYEDAFDLFRMYRDQRYEGAILRVGEDRYEDGKRSKSLLKIKEWHDCECKVINIFRSKDDWAILECLFDNGRPFRCSAPGTVRDKKMVLINSKDYVGRYVTVEYANITKDGVPFHPVAKCWRES